MGFVTAGLGITYVHICILYHIERTSEAMTHGRRVKVVWVCTSRIMAALPRGIIRVLNLGLNSRRFGEMFIAVCT